MPNQLPIIILIAEDEETDAFFAQKAFEDAEVENEIHIVKDGQEVLQFLKQEGEHQNAPRPDMILLDIKMPRMDGHEALSEIRSDEGLKDIPVIMFSGSDSPSDVKKSYSHLANAHVPKCKGLRDMQDFVGTLERFWFDRARLPQERPI